MENTAYVIYIISPSIFVYPSTETPSPDARYQDLCVSYSRPARLPRSHIPTKSILFQPTIVFALSQSSNNFSLTSTRQKPKDADSKRSMFEGWKSDPCSRICSSCSLNTVRMQYLARIRKFRMGPCRVWRFSSKERVRSFVLTIKVGGQQLPEERHEPVPRRKLRGLGTVHLRHPLPTSLVGDKSYAQSLLTN